MIDDDHSDVGDIIADMVRELEPIHAVMASFRQGGDRCAKWVERLHERLIDLAQRVRGLEAAAEDDDDDADPLLERRRKPPRAPDGPHTCLVGRSKPIDLGKDIDHGFAPRCNAASRRRSRRIRRQAR
jgi:hypothetical protein